MTCSTIEELAQGIFSLGGFEDEEPRSPGLLAMALLGPRNVLYGPTSQVAPFALTLDPDRLYLSSRLDDAGLAIAVSRGIARWWTERNVLPELDDADIEELALALALPARTFRSAAVDVGFDVEALAEEFVCSEPLIRKRMRRLTLASRSGTYVRFGAAS